ncbi:MAG: hypothetical protein AMXMBFR7_50370 [Planctomycetota bacterium]
MLRPVSLSCIPLESFVLAHLPGGRMRVRANSGDVVSRLPLRRTGRLCVGVKAVSARRQTRGLTDRAHARDLGLVLMRLLHLALLVSLEAYN